LETHPSTIPSISRSDQEKKFGRGSPQKNSVARRKVVEWSKVEKNRGLHVWVSCCGRRLLGQGWDISEEFLDAEGMVS